MDEGVAEYPGLERVSPYSVAGHDRECADAMWRQARNAHGRPGAYASGALDPQQVEHLLQIGYRAGRAEA